MTSPSVQYFPSFAVRRLTHQTRVDVSLFVFRVGFASLLIGLHGGSRLVRAIRYFAFGEPWAFVRVVESIGLPIPLLFASLSTAADSLCASFVLVGFLTRWAAAVIAINMAVAMFFELSGGDSFELPALYLLAAISLSLSGAGFYSLDTLRLYRSNLRSRLVQ